MKEGSGFGTSVPPTPTEQVIKLQLQSASGYLNVHVVLWYVDKGGEALAKPHGDLSVHVDGKRFKTFLQTTHGVVLEGAGVLAQVHTSDLRHAQTAYRDET